MALTISGVGTAGNTTHISFSGVTGEATLYRALGSATITNVEDAIASGTLEKLYTSVRDHDHFFDDGLLPETTYKYYVVDETGNAFASVTTLTVIDLVPNNAPDRFSIASSETLQFAQIERYVPLSGNKSATILVLETDEPITQDDLEAWFSDGTVAAEIVATEEVGALTGMTPSIRLIFSLLYDRK